MYGLFEQKELWDYLSNPEVRHLYIDSSTRHLLAMQLRSMRETLGWSQIELGQKAEMKQSAIARLEDPRYSSMTVSTLKRLAKAFDVALIVRFAPFSEFIPWITQVDEPRLSPPSFGKEQSFVTEFTTHSGISNWESSKQVNDTKDMGVYDINPLIPPSNIPSTTTVKEKAYA